MELTIAIVGAICTVLSITFAILTYAKGKTKDNSDLISRLAKIETDIIYIRENIEKREAWERDIEKRLRKLETREVK